MRTVPLRHLAEINPPTPQLDRLAETDQVTFAPLEVVWSDGRLDLLRTRPAGEVRGSYTRFLDGDVLVPKVTPTFQAGRSAIASKLANGVGAGTTELHILRPTSGADARYVRYGVLSSPFLQEGVAAFQGVAGLQRVPDEFVRNFHVIERPLDEQRRIADFLDDQVARIDNIVDVRRESVAAFDERRQSMIRDLVIGAWQRDRRSCRLGWVSDLPEGWNVRRLAQLARMGSGHTPSRNVGEFWIDCAIPWLTTSDVHRFRSDELTRVGDTVVRISALGLANSAAVMHQAGTVALCRTASAGFSVVMDVDMATSQDFVTWTCGDELVPDYLLWVLRVMRPWLLGYLATGSTHKTIYFPDLEALRVPHPPVSEQVLIASRCGEVNEWSHSAVSQLREQIELLEERKRSLITAAVTGEFDVSSAGERATEV